jgi:hypothetical protein
MIVMQRLSSKFEAASDRTDYGRRFGDAKAAGKRPHLRRGEMTRA